MADNKEKSKLLDGIYPEKKKFVERLLWAMQTIPDVEGLKYFRFDNGEEYVRITWKNGRDYVCVTADSKTAIMMDIAKAVDRAPDAALILNEKHADLIDQWIAEGRHISK